MNNYQDLSFFYNWNNKLDCNAFTTLRLTDKYNVGEKVNVILNKQVLFIGQFIGKKKIFLKDINEYIAHIDTGYDAEETKNILKKMYSKKNVNWDSQNIYFYLVKKTNEKL